MQGLIVFGLLFLTACAPDKSIKPTVKAVTGSSGNTVIKTAYDYQLRDKHWVSVTLEEVAQAINDSDVVFVGEYHGNHASHLLQIQLFEMLYRLNEKRGMVLSMEMFETDQQTVLDEYLDGFVGERYLINEANAWKNYQGSYRLWWSLRSNMPCL